MDIDFIKEQFCRYKCTINKNDIFNPEYIEEEFECDDCGSFNAVQVEKPEFDCENCQIQNFIDEIRSYGIKI